MTPEQRIELDVVFEKHGFTDFKWMDPGEIVVSCWVRMKCMFGCPDYLGNASCPPNTPSVPECRQFFNEYTVAAVFHFEKAVEKPKDRKAWSKTVNQSLLKLEREVFISGYHKAFMLLMASCNLCSECQGEKKGCKLPYLARPTPEGLAVDVFATVRKLGYPIEVLSDYTRLMNRYAVLLIE